MSVSRVASGLAMGLLGLPVLVLAAACGYAAMISAQEILWCLFMLILGIGALAGGVGLVIAGWRAVFSESPKGTGQEPAASGMTVSWVFAAYLVFVCAMLMQAVHPWSLPILFYLLISQYLLVGVHEFGHVVAARAAGFVPTELKIGLGPEIISFSWGKLRFGMGVFCVAGSVAVNQGEGGFSRSKILMFLLGGPVVSLLVCFLAVGGVFRDPFSQPLLVQIVMGIFAVQNLLLVFGLFISKLTIDGRQVKPLLPAIWQCLVSSDPQWEQVRAPWQEDFEKYLHCGLWKEAFEKGSPHFPAQPQPAQLYGQFLVWVGREAVPILESQVENTLSGGVPCSVEERCWLLFTRGGCHAYQGQMAAAEKCFDEAVEKVPSDLEKVTLCESAANLVIVGGLRDLLPLIDRYSELALQLLPGEITLKGTRGSILVELGRMEAGRTLLLEVVECSESYFDQAIASFYLALADVKTGELASARQWRRRVNRFAPPAWLIARTKEFDAPLIAGGIEPPK